MKQRDKNTGRFLKTPGIKVNCIVCNKEIECSPSLLKTKKYCSRDCKGKQMSKDRVGKVQYKMTDKIKEKIRKTKTGVQIWGGKRDGMDWMKGENHHNWKGDEVGYDALHDWITKNANKIGKCSICGASKDTKDGRTYTQWANISGEYKRDIDDYRELCPSCHLYLDKNHIDIQSIERKSWA